MPARPRSTEQPTRLPAAPTSGKRRSLRPKRQPPNCAPLPRQIFYASRHQLPAASGAGV